MEGLGKYWQYFKWLLIFTRFRCRQYRFKSSEYFIANINSGAIKGVKRKSIWNNDFVSFEKIPFAKPPIGELRFKAPVPVDPWKNLLDCTEEGPMPVQGSLTNFREVGKEDCLFLNVYTKNLNPDKPMPVMVWIYGGGFETGGAVKDMYSPDYFMSEEIVLITFTYRVGPFGFLSLNDETLNVPGNAGLKDQVLALKWVKENCKEFGGDSNNITVFGESAGGASTHYMMLTEHTKNLFHKAILMSGCCLTNWATVPDRNWAFKLAKSAGYQGGQSHESVLKFLQNAKTKDLIEAERKILEPDDRKNRIMFPFGPVIEPYLTKDSIITESPKIMMRNSWGNEIPILIGGTSNEGLILYPDLMRQPKIISQLNNCEYLVPLELNLDRKSEKCHELGLKLKRAYFNEKSTNSKNEYMDLMSYKLFWHGLTRTVQSRLKFSSSPTYLYRFDYDSPNDFNLVKLIFCGKNVRGACHADDLSYLFLNGITSTLRTDSKEYQMIKTMIKTLTQFAATGNPNNEMILPAKWEPVESNIKPLKCLNVADKIEFIELPENEKLKVWNELYETESVELI